MSGEANPGTAGSGSQPQQHVDYPMRLQKFLARAGVASRRGSENLMTAGRVTVNGRVVTELGSKVDPNADHVEVDGIPVVWGSKPVVIVLNKPAGYVSTMKDPHARYVVAELVPTREYPGLFPVGRLDADTTGVLLFTTDGELGHQLLGPKHHVEKVYEALVEGFVTDAELEQLRRGVELEDGPTLPAKVRRLSGDGCDSISDGIAGGDAEDADSGCQRGSDEARGHDGGASGRGGSGGTVPPSGTSIIELTLTEGRKREVKRMCEAVGHPVVRLHRRSFGSVELGDLPEGSWRLLDEDEVQALRDCIG